MRAFALPIQAKLVALALGCSLLAACSTGGSDGSGIAFKGSSSGSEEQGSILIRFERDPIVLPFGVELKSISLDYTTESGTAESGVDFVPTSGTISWGRGHDGTRAFEVELIDDSEVEGTTALSCFWAATEIEKDHRRSVGEGCVRILADRA